MRFFERVFPAAICFISISYYSVFADEPDGYLPIPVIFQEDFETEQVRILKIVKTPLDRVGVAGDDLSLSDRDILRFPEDGTAIISGNSHLDKFNVNWSFDEQFASIQYPIPQKNGSHGLVTNTDIIKIDTGEIVARYKNCNNAEWIYRENSFLITCRNPNYDYSSESKINTIVKINRLDNNWDLKITHQFTSDWFSKPLLTNDEKKLYAFSDLGCQICVPYWFLMDITGERGGHEMRLWSYLPGGLRDAKDQERLPCMGESRLHWKPECYIPDAPDYLGLSGRKEETFIHFRNVDSSYSDQELNFPELFEDPVFKNYCKNRGSYQAFASISPQLSSIICLRDESDTLTIGQLGLPEKLIRDAENNREKRGIAELSAAAGSAYNKKDFLTAAKLWRKILAIDPFHVEALNNIGFVLTDKKVDSKPFGFDGISYLVAAIEINPKRSSAWLNLGDAYAEKRLSFSERSFHFDFDLKGYLTGAYQSYREYLALTPEGTREETRKRVLAMMDELQEMLDFGPPETDETYSSGGKKFQVIGYPNGMIRIKVNGELVETTDLCKPFPFKYCGYSEMSLTVRPESAIGDGGIMALSTESNWAGGNRHECYQELVIARILPTGVKTVIRESLEFRDVWVSENLEEVIFYSNYDKYDPQNNWKDPHYYRPGKLLDKKDQSRKNNSKTRKWNQKLGVYSE